MTEITPAYRGASSQQLTYEARAPWHRRRWFRHAILVLILIGVVLAGRRWGRRVWVATQIRYWQHRCLAYTPSTSLIEGYENPATPGSAPPFTAPVPRCWAELNRLAGNTATLSPVFFLHERTSKKGVRRLVVIQEANSLGGGLPLVIQTASGLALPKAGVPDIDLQFDLHFSPQLWQEAHRIDAGKTDPADPSHLTIAFRAGKGPTAVNGKLDAWLSDDGNGLKVRITTPTVQAPGAMTGTLLYSAASGSFSGSAHFKDIQIAMGGLPLSGGVSFTGTIPMLRGTAQLTSTATVSSMLNITNLSIDVPNVPIGLFYPQVRSGMNPPLFGASGTLAPTTAPPSPLIEQFQGEVEITPLTQPTAAPQTRPNAPDKGTEQ